MRAVLFCLLLLSLPAQAREWTDSEKAWGAAFVAARVIDCGQTRHIARHPDKWREANPLVSDHPGLGEVNRFFVLSTGLALAAAHYLPQYRKQMLQVWVGLSVAASVRNFAIGVRVEF